MMTFANRSENERIDSGQKFLQMFFGVIDDSASLRRFKSFPSDASPHDTGVSNHHRLLLCLPDSLFILSFQIKL